MDNMEDYLEDMEEELDQHEFSEGAKNALRRMASWYVSMDQLENKGKLLKRFEVKRKGLYRGVEVYFDVYENAVGGVVKQAKYKKPCSLSIGLAYIKNAYVVNKILYLVTQNNTINEVYNIKQAEMAAYFINKQKGIEQK